MIENTPVKIKRHRTAIKRASFSLPVKCMLRDGLLDKSKTMFDYGCGHGRDLDLLENMEIECTGWDPSFRPDAAITRAEIVNLSYVLNVIEDINERSQALHKAWSLCDSLLTVAAQIEFAAPDKEQEQFGDGVLTSRQTFQKYYNQHELREYIESELGEDAITAAPGVFYVFKDEQAKQQFIANRFHRRITVPRRRISEVLFEQNQDVLEPLMGCLTQYGRLPAPEECEQTAELVDRFGSLKRAFKLIQKVTDESPWEEIAQKRTEDLLVYLALARFKKRPPLSKLPVTIQHDVKSFLGGYKIACGRADALLFRAGDPDAIDQACQRATVGQLVDNALILHRSSLDYLEPLLRIYEGCARALVGEIDEANVIKLHRFSGKVSYVAYPDFEKLPHPPLRQRIKVSLPTLSIDLFDYSHWQDPPLLFRKDELLHNEHPKAKLFQALAKQEERVGLLPTADSQLSASKWQAKLEQAGLQLRGHRLITKNT
ncbi:DNA phosphorothioation-associated putative methyltransferase [Rubripirellula amarantea]|uniref:DNA phosphorothioation-associated putative methyltransferase n=1 Tax=Rubripirellula amarantea TaxID=2527999 RepID=UPI0013EEFE4F|nr:DNA phosphorothioation-associated putative methyltransferase [Rubripirellula amarantea]